MTVGTYDLDWDRKLQALTDYLCERTTMTREEAAKEARRQLLDAAADKAKRDLIRCEPSSST